MDSSVALPQGWDLVKRYTWCDKEKNLFVRDRDNAEVPYREVFAREISTGDLYLWKLVIEDGKEKSIHIERPDMVRGKAISILFFMPLYLIVKCARDVFIMLSSIVVDTIHGRVWCVIKDVGHFVWGKMRDPFFAIAVMACALFTIIMPFDGRKQVARVERKWHHVDELKLAGERIHYQECRHDTCDLDKEKIPVIFSRNHYFLIAYCFQPHGNSQDSRYLVKPLVNAKTFR